MKAPKGQCLHEYVNETTFGNFDECIVFNMDVSISRSATLIINITHSQLSRLMGHTLNKNIIMKGFRLIHTWHDPKSVHLTLSSSTQCYSILTQTDILVCVSIRKKNRNETNSSYHQFDNYWGIGLIHCLMAIHREPRAVQYQSANEKHKIKLGMF